MSESVLWRGGAFSRAHLGGGLAAALTLAFTAAALAEQLRAPEAAPQTIEAAADKTSLPSARRLIDGHLTAIGGREAVERHQSTHVRGSVSMPAAGISGTLELYAARPNKTLLRISLEGVGEVTEGFDGQVGWSVSPLTGPMLLEGRQLEEKRFDAEFDQELRREGRYVSMTTIEKIEFDGRECYKVRLVRTTGGEDIEFYDVRTGLKAGGITTRETPMGTMTATTVETDYRRFGSLLHPTTVRQRAGGMEQVVTITSIEYDAVPNDVFDLPSEIRALLR